MNIKNNFNEETGRLILIVVIEFVFEQLSIDSSDELTYENFDLVYNYLCDKVKLLNILHLVGISETLDLINFYEEFIK